MKKQINGKWEKVRRYPVPELLRGNPELMTALIDSLSFQNRYNVATLSFEASDIPVDRFNNGESNFRKIVDILIDQFYESAFVGIPKLQRPAILASTHTHTGRLEVNIVIPRYVISSMGQIRSYSPVVPRIANHKLWNAFQDYANLLFGFADPRDPKRRRAVAVPNYVLSKWREAERLGITSYRSTEIMIAAKAMALLSANSPPKNRIELLVSLRPTLSAMDSRVVDTHEDSVVFGSKIIIDSRRFERKWALRGERMAATTSTSKCALAGASATLLKKLNSAQSAYDAYARDWGWVNAARYGFCFNMDVAAPSPFTAARVRRKHIADADPLLERLSRRGDLNDESRDYLDGAPASTPEDDFAFPMPSPFSSTSNWPGLS